MDSPTLCNRSCHSSNQGCIHFQNYVCQWDGWISQEMLQHLNGTKVSSFLPFMDYTRCNAVSNIVGKTLHCFPTYHPQHLALIPKAQSSLLDPFKSTIHTFYRHSKEHQQLLLSPATRGHWMKPRWSLVRIHGFKWQINGSSFFITCHLQEWIS